MNDIDTDQRNAFNDLAITIQQDTMLSLVSDAIQYTYQLYQLAPTENVKDNAAAALRALYITGGYLDALNIN